MLHNIIFRISNCKVACFFVEYASWQDNSVGAPHETVAARTRASTLSPPSNSYSGQRNFTTQHISCWSHSVASRWSVSSKRTDHQVCVTTIVPSSVCSLVVATGPAYAVWHFGYAKNPWESELLFPFKKRLLAGRCDELFLVRIPALSQVRQLDSLHIIS